MEIRAYPQVWGLEIRVGNHLVKIASSSPRNAVHALPPNAALAFRGSATGRETPEPGMQDR
jgi:hypothetical protein